MGQSLLEGCDRLLDDLRDAIAAVNKTGGAAQMAGRLAEAEQALARAKGLEAIRRELEGVRERLKALVADKPETQHRIRELDQGRAPSGAKTSQDAYRVPILQILVARGGAARTKVVLDAVYEQMKDTLNKWDLAPMPSSPRAIRWRRTAEWARNGLREEGLIAANSPHGIWEITEAGRRWLEEQEKVK